MTLIPSAADLEAELNRLHAELELCRGGGYVGRLKSRIIQAQIVRIVQTLKNRIEQEGLDMEKKSPVRLELEQEFVEENLLPILNRLCKSLSPGGTSSLDCLVHDLQQALNAAKSRDLNNDINT
jgi:hypothetical protein